MSFVIVSLLLNLFTEFSHPTNRLIFQQKKFPPRKICPGRLMSVLYTFNLRPVSGGLIESNNLPLANSFYAASPKVRLIFPRIQSWPLLKGSFITFVFALYRYTELFSLKDFESLHSIFLVSLIGPLLTFLFSISIPSRFHELGGHS